MMFIVSMMVSALMVFASVMMLALMVVFVFMLVMRMFQSTKRAWRKNSRNVAFENVLGISGHDDGNRVKYCQKLSLQYVEAKIRIVVYVTVL